MPLVGEVRRAWERRRWASSADLRRIAVERMRKWRLKNPEKRNASNRRCADRLRLQLLSAYGGKCECCDETEPRFLTLEHKNHDGGTHRRSLGNRGVYADLRRKGWPKDGYGLLCMNCNFAEKDGRICPHKEKPNGI